MAKRATSLALTLLLGFCFMLSAVTGLEVAKWVEHKWFPVVTGFTIEEATHMSDGNSIVIKGSLSKVRDCRFVEVVGLSEESKFIEVTFLDRLGAKTSRPVGISDYGPWRLTPDSGKVTLMSRHQCHMLWDSTTVLFEGKV